MTKAQASTRAMKRVVAMDLSQHTALHVGSDRYFLLWADAEVRLVRDRCPHRGGPLSLGKITPDGRRLTCPWHGTNVSLAAMKRTAVPMVRTGDRAFVVVPDVSDGSDAAGDVPVTPVRRQILAGCPPVFGHRGEEGEQR